jgi:tRNA (guanine37-N1)-methyltransferase
MPNEEIANARLATPSRHCYTHASALYFPMKIDILTLFPEIALSPLSESIIKRAQAAGIVEIQAHQLRDWATDKHKKTDDTLCGGGPGMLLKPEPLFTAIEALRGEDTLVILMTPQGKVFQQFLARELAQRSHLLLVCGHYEGVDHRVIEQLIDLELSIGDYVLTNGAIAAAVVSDAVVRLLPGALGDDRSSIEESFTRENLLEAPAYTKPAEFRGLQVPEVLLSGNHKNIASWQAQQALERTRQNRPDLLP